MVTGDGDGPIGNGGLAKDRGLNAMDERYLRLSPDYVLAFKKFEQMLAGGISVGSSVTAVEEGEPPTVPK